MADSSKLPLKLPSAKYRPIKGFPRKTRQESYAPLRALLVNGQNAAECTVFCIL
ncbi:hypothetical protein PI125_g4652 [Phytophthora idaei]|nr:hypothetical protein PI125_g4652 [Phytophthora idaei]